MSIKRVVESGWYVLGEELERFESSWSEICNVKFGVGVGNGMDAIEIILRTLGITHGDEVITTPMTAFATITAIIRAGAKPILADIDPGTGLLSVDSVVKCINKKTKAIILVHLYGQIKHMDQWQKLCKTYSIKLIEDCAQSHYAFYKGKSAGSFGDAGAFSFYPTKNLGGIGDGGGITTDNEDLYLRLRMLRQYGWAETRNSQIVSQLSRLDELQASILRIKLKHLDSNNQKRISLAHVYDQCLDRTKFILPSVREGNTHVFHLYVVRVSNRSRYLNELPKKNIYPGIHYEWPVHLNDAYKSKIGRISGSLLNTELASQTVMSLPMYPELTDRDIQYISEVANNV
jgi:dTDP-4-amino-4,6-dideoxygalactose transaminase